MFKKGNIPWNKLKDKQRKYKKCSKCKEIKSRQEFHVEKCKVDGISYICKKCAYEKFLLYKKNNPSKMKLFKRRHYLKHKEAILLKHKTPEYKERANFMAREFRKNNPEEARKRDKIGYSQKDKPTKNKNARKCYLNIMNEWVGIIPKETNCEICDKKIFFATGKLHNSSLCLDHKSRDVAIPHRPATWLHTHRRNKENEKIFLSCNFGYLCPSCNTSLITERRSKFVIGAAKYVFGIDINPLIKKAEE